MEYTILFHLDRAPTLVGLSEGENKNGRGRERDLLEVEELIIRLCIQIGDSPEFDKLCHAKVCLELACAEYLKYIKTGKRDKKLLPLKPELNESLWKRSISPRYCHWEALEDDYM